MQFLYPNFLWALAALAIPIIIHLFYFRRFKKVAFSNVKFLKEVKEETSMRSRLRNLLVLLARCLAVAALVFAFAQPFIPSAREVLTGRKAVSLFVDNSFSMGAESDSAKTAASAIANMGAERTCAKNVGILARAAPQPARAPQAPLREARPPRSTTRHASGFEKSPRDPTVENLRPKPVPPGNQAAQRAASQARGAYAGAGGA